ncbi:hypothetical protein [Roseateles violae]|uniref:Uncharacterized protein n=1 Tax=Roseateles violae TaxID=3058042 RepID=A0ABT8DMA7_9BURK|nr:hypothetical protein [Pelomonas sp. PFR6]MDN3919525.1 hypothetical protein [Pelomonas sp. PFR6]
MGLLAAASARMARLPRRGDGPPRIMQDARKDDFDPTHLLDGWRPSEPARPVAPPELDLSALHAEPRQRPPEPRLDAERLARLKKRGFEMDDIEDVELPEIVMPIVETTPALDTAGLDQALSAAAGIAQQQGRGAAEPRIDLPLSARAETSADPRLLRQWRPGAWVGVRRRLIGASTELVSTPQGPLVETRPPQWLLAVWPPQGLEMPLLSRWPERAMLLPAQQSVAAAQLLLQQAVPATAPLWIGELDADWALLAELVLLHDASLQPFQIEALRALTESDRLQRFERLNNAYQPAPAGGALRRPPA